MLPIKVNYLCEPTKLVSCIWYSKHDKGRRKKKDFQLLGLRHRWGNVGGFPQKNQRDRELFPALLSDRELLLLAAYLYVCACCTTPEKAALGQEGVLIVHTCMKCLAGPGAQQDDIVSSVSHGPN